jgi:excisionase family DNA binding protein
MLLTVVEVAALLRMTPKAVYYLVEMRRIPHVKIGRSLRFQRDDVLAWVTKNRVPSLEK